MEKHTCTCIECGKSVDLITRAHPHNSEWRMLPTNRIVESGFYPLNNPINTQYDLMVTHLQFICVDCFETSDDFIIVTDIVAKIDDTIIDGHGDRQFQDDCYHCIDCGEWYHSESEWHETVSGDSVCQSCRDCGEWTYTQDSDCYLVHYDTTFTCGDCGEHYANEDYAIECCGGNRGDWCCYSTNIFHEIGNYYVDYKTDPTLRGNMAGGQVLMRHKSPSLLVYGVENEIECRNGITDLCDAMRDDSSNIVDYSILKEDSSIQGLELVTLPATLAAHQRHIEWAQFCENVRPYGRGHHGHGNGMHIHCDRAAIGALTLGKLLVFFNSEHNSQLLTDIAQRPIHNSNQWCRQSPHDYDKCGKSGKNPNVTGKYSALNVTSYTVECRIFNATLVPDRILKNIEFYDAAIQWCRVTPVSVIEAAHCRDSFLRFVIFNRKQYPHLHEFLVKRYSPYVAYPENRKELQKKLSANESTVDALAVA